MRRALIVLVCVELLSFGLSLTGMGFYSDDWAVLQWTSGGLLDGIRTLAAKGIYWPRPVEIVYYPLIRCLLGSHPLPYHIFLLSLEVLEGWLLFLLLSRLIERRDIALLAAALALVFPNHAATHHWYSGSVQLVAIVMTLASMLLHLRWLETRRGGWLAAGLACYLTGLLTYESCAFLPLLLAGGLLAASIQKGDGWRSALRRTVLDMSPYAAALTAALAWQWFVVSWAAGARNPKSLGISLDHIIEVVRAGAGCSTGKAFKLCARTLLAALRDLGWAHLVLWPVFVTGAVYVLRPRDAERPLLWRTFWIGAACFFGAVLPYFFAARYMPDAYGPASRTCAVLALADGILLAAAVAGLGRLAGKGAGEVLLALCLGMFTWHNWHTASQWARSWRMQQGVLRLASKHARSLPEGAAMLVSGVPILINTRGNEVHVFGAAFDMTSALRLSSGRGDISADVLTERMRFEPERVADGPQGPFYSYKNLYLYRYDEDRLERLDGPPKDPPAAFNLR